MTLKHIFATAALALPLALNAQTITFEEGADEYKALGVYDTWEASPFRTGALQGNYAVIDNHLIEIEESLGEAPNGSGKILAVQRSRFGSNTFGVRIDLKETFELTPTTQYLHVMVNRPYGGRVMVVGLGKRQDRAGQSPETEQFWAMSTSNIPANQWQDVVLPIKGNGGIDIYSLVVVPDCESPHNYTEDAACYIDNIEINNSSTSRLIYGFYPINFDKGQLYTRSDRRLNGISLKNASGETQSATIPASPNTMYVNLDTQEFTARAGETVTPTFNYAGNWMHGYVFLDHNDDGKYNAAMNDDLTIAEGSEVMTFSFYGGGDNDNGQNSAGTSLTGANRNVLNPPAFKIPEGLENGYYRLRFKVDWNSVDPGGSLDQTNPILGNGGAIVDIRLNIHGDYCNVNDANRNGEVLAADGTKLVKYQTEFGKPFTIKMNPENGFEYAGIIVKHGYNLSEDSLKHENVQWQAIRFSRKLFNENDEFTIPGEYMNGDIEIEGLFIEEGTYVPEPDPEIPTRYTTTKVEDGNFADGTTWYTIQIGQQGYVLYNNGSATHIALNNTTIDTDNPAHLWCFTGNEEEGYRLYNMEAGATKVLAAPTTMQGNTGKDSYPTLQPLGNLPSGYTDLWMFEDSDDLGSTDVSHAYMYEKGYTANKVNNRDNKLAFWNGGADGGSTLQICFAKVTSNPTGIVTVTPVGKAKTIYDLSGRRVANPEKGLYIVDGKKVLVK